MAVDEVLLQNAAANLQWTLRLYSWSEPTLSLGYFQANRDRLAHLSSRGLPLVRRVSGGGAIVHDQELTYSLTGPLRAHRSADALPLVWRVHSAWVELLAVLGVEASLCEAAAADRTAPEPFLCFQRQTAGDVLVGNVKIAGSAQRIRAGTILQHGSVLWTSSSAAPELPGLSDLTPARAGLGASIEPALACLSQTLGFMFEPVKLTHEQKALVTGLVREKYGRMAWNERR
jgi:lipoate-protein ligase A